MTVSPLSATLLATTVSIAGLGACTDESEGTAIGVAKPTSSDCMKAASGSTAAGDGRCVISQREGKSLALQVFGLQTLCLDHELLEEIPWHVAAREEASGRLVVSLHWPSDQTPACGSCFYNFKVQLGPHDWQERTDINFEVRSCPTCGVDDSRSVTLGTKADERATHACGDELLDAGA